jgi:glycine hydroxymethyltransferase
LDPSGIRIGTAAISTRGFKECDCARVAEIMIEILQNKNDKKIKEQTKKEIKKLAKKFQIHKKS